MAKEGTFQLLGQPNPDVADINKGRIFWNTISDSFQQIDENGIIKDLTSENPGGNDTNIQFNNFGTLGGSDTFVFDGTAVGIGTLTPNASSILDLTSTARGFLMPVMTTIQRDAIPSPATGLEIYNITAAEPEFFNGSIWLNTGGTAAGGSDTQVQFNSNGDFAGITGVTTDGSSLSFGNLVPAQFGLTGQLKIEYTGTVAEIQNLSGDMLIINQGAALGDIVIENFSSINDIINRLGTATNTTGFEIHDGLSATIFKVQGDGKSVFGSISDASALLTLDSTNSGFLMPVMTTIQRDAIPSPATGLEIYNITTNEPEFFDGLAWITTGGTAPGGSNTQIQYNDNGAFNGITLITTDGFNLDFGNATQARFGSGNDLSIQHTSAEAQIKNITGNLSIFSQGGDFVLTSGGDDQIFKLGTIDGSNAVRIQNAIGTDLLIADSAGKVGIGTSPTTSALLTLGSTTSGFLMPVMTTTQRDLISLPATGLEIYNLTTNEPEFFDGAAWITTGGTAPGGSSPQVQFNNNGAFDGIAGVTSDGNNMDWSNGARAQFGDFQELKIEHIGNSLITNSTGELQVIQLASSDIVVRLSNNGNLIIQNFAAGEAIRITDFGEVGIGSSNPASILHLLEGPQLITPVLGTLLTIENNSDDSLMSILGENQKGIFFGDLADNNDGSIIFDAIPSGFEFRTGGGLLAVSIDANQDMNFPDNNRAQFGAEADLAIFHNGTDSLIENFTNTFLVLNSSAAGDLRLQNNATTGKVIAALATLTNTTSFDVHDSSDAELFTVKGDGEVQISKGPLTTPSGTTGVSLAINTGTGSSGNGGDFTVTAGDGLINGGAIGLFAGAPTQTDTPGAGIEIAGGNGTGTGSGGPVELDGGTPLGTGAIGHVILQGDGGNVGIFTSAPDSKLTIVEEIHLPVLGSWNTQTSAVDNIWDDIAFGNNTFVAISTDGTDRVMRSADNGVSWTSISTPLDTVALAGIAFGNGTFVVVAPGNNNIMTSIDNGLTWVQKTSPSDNGWEAVTFGNGLFVMVVGVGAAEPKSAFSSDNGATWTLGQTSGGGGIENNFWNDVAFGDGTFVACANNGTNRVAHSINGDLWTSATTTLTSPNSITFGNGVFVMVDDSGPNDTIARSTDKGVSWTTIIPPTLNNWRSVAFGNGTFIAISTNGSGDRSISSIDLGLTWQTLTTPVDNIWRAIAFGNDNFVAVSGSGTSNRVMTILVTLIESTSILDLQSTTSGLLLPRMTNTQRDLIPTPVAGLEVFNTTSELLNFYNGDLWKGLAPASNEVVYVNALSDFPTPVATLGAWTIQTSAEDNFWQGVTFGNNLFVAVASTGTNRVMTSPDGITWTPQTAAEANVWRSVTFGNNLFVAVSDSGTNRVMTSPDAITWSPQLAASASTWSNITFGNGLFVAVASSIATNQVMTSPDGITWTSRTAAAANEWRGVTFGNNLFVAVASTGTNRVMTSPDGITWTPQTAAEANVWRSVTFGNNLFVAVSDSGTNRVMTSPDAITWTSRTAAAANGWRNITFGKGLFVAVSDSGTGDRAMSSSDGITWTTETTPADNDWLAIIFGNIDFVAVASTGTGDRAMTAPVSDVITLLGGTTYKILDDVDIGNIQLLIVDGGTVIQGFNVSQTTLSGTTTVPLIQANNFPNIRDIIIQQNGTGELYNTTVGLFSFNVLWFGGDMRFVSGPVAIFNGGTIQLGARVIQDAAGGVTDLVFRLGFTIRDNAGAIDGLIEFESGSTTNSLTFPGNGIFLTNSSVGIKINQGATINNFDFDSNALGITNASSVMIELENPDAVLLGSLDNSNFTGAGIPFRCNPISSSNFTPDALTTLEGITIDGDGNLIIADPATNLIVRYVGISSTVDISIAAPGSNVAGVVWLKGDLYSTDAVQNLIYRHTGFSTTVTSIAGGGTSANMLTTDGTNIIFTDNDDFLVRVLDGFSTTILFSFTTPAGTGLSGIAFDGVNLLVTDSTVDVHVLKGITGTNQYSFPIATGASDFADITISDRGFVASDLAGSKIFVYDHPVTFDHSAATWQITNNQNGIIASSDRGGSQFFIEDTSPIALPVFVQNIWQDVAATDIFYGPFNAMEKCRLFDELNGEIEWTGTRERGRIIQAQFTITRSSGGAADKFYEISVEVNGTIQKDSISIGVLPTTTTILTLTSLAITRDLVDGNPIKVQIRQTTTGVATTEVYSCRLSIN